MKQRFAMLLFVCVAMSISSLAQLSREDKQEKNDAREARMAKKNDYTVFRRQMLGLKEYAAEKKKIPALQKANKGVVKVTAFIDSNDNDDEAKTIIGYIRQDIGDNSTNMYEVIYDRGAKKITSVKRTPEAMDADKEAADDKEEAAADKKSPAKKTTAKKSKDDDDDDPDDDKPAKNKKEKDDD
jgi:hypothetical protein